MLIRAERLDLHDTSYARVHGGAEKMHRGIGMEALEIVTRRIAENADRVDQRIDAVEGRRIARGIREARKVERHDPATRQPVARGTRIAYAAYDRVALSEEPARHGRSDEPGCTCKEDDHDHPNKS